MFEKIIFGSYGTYAFSDKKRPLVWQNEFASDRKAIVTLTELLPERAYDLDAGGNDWRDSELRAWLNKEFIEEAFTKKEQEAIYPKDLATWREYYPGDVSYSKDRITIPEAGHRYDIRPKKSLRNHLLEGAFQGCWLRNGVKVTRTAYIDEKEKTRVKDGADPRRKLSVAPVLYLEPEKLPEKIVRDTLRTIENGVLLDDDFFYCNGEHIRYHVDRTGEFAYVLTDRKEAVIVGEFLTEIFEDRELVFPGKLDRYPVIAILGEYRLKSVKRIVVEEGIRMIGEECFVLCDVLEEVVLPDTLLDLHSSNFTACPKLIKVHISEGNPHYCIDENAIYTKDRKKLIKYISADDDQVFTVPEGVEEIAPGAFSEVRGMKEIGLPNSMVRLGAYAFSYADVEQVYLNEGLTFIDECAFLGSRLKKIILPETAVYLKERIFENCKHLQKVVFPKKVDYFGEQMLKGCSILKSVRLPEGTRVLRGTFTDCMLLKQVYVPQSVKEIDEKAWNPDGELTVYGTDGSEAEAYAKKHALPFSTEAFDEKRFEKETIYRSSLNEIKKAEKGDMITFGSFMQRADETGKEPVEWKVLKREGNKILVLSKDALADLAYDVGMNGADSIRWDQTVDWRFSELRSFLNGPLRFSLLSDAERDCVSELFLLSAEEMKAYLPTEEERIAFRTEYNYVRHGLKKKANWWLRSVTKKPDQGVVYQDMVLENGELSCSSSNVVQSVRPAMWIDVEKVEKHLFPDNETYIKNWILSHNQYMEERKDKEEYLDLLVFYTVIFEILAGINKSDILIADNGRVRIVSGPAVTGDAAERILKNVNFAFAYVGLSYAKRSAGWRYLTYLSGVLNKEELKLYYKDWYEKTMRQYGDAYLSRDVYIIKGKVFYADQPLTEAEIEYIRIHERGDQMQYSVDHDEYGMRWW